MQLCKDLPFPLSGLSLGFSLCPLLHNLTYSLNQCCMHNSSCLCFLHPHRVIERRHWAPGRPLVQTSAPPLSSCAMLGKFPNCSRLPSPHLKQRPQGPPPRRAAWRAERVSTGKRANRAWHCNRSQLSLRRCLLHAMPWDGRGVSLHKPFTDRRSGSFCWTLFSPDAAALRMQLRPLPGWLHRRRWTRRGGPPLSAAQSQPHPVPSELSRVGSPLPSPPGFPPRGLERQWLALSPGWIASLLLAKECKGLKTTCQLLNRFQKCGTSAPWNGIYQ